MADADWEDRRTSRHAFRFMVGEYAERREDSKENEMRCSHGVPYEAKCSKCFAEAMTREILRASMAHTEQSVVRKEHGHNVTLSSVGYVKSAWPVMA
jgi:hypothetical protein